MKNDKDKLERIQRNIGYGIKYREKHFGKRLKENIKVYMGENTKEGVSPNHDVSIRVNKGLSFVQTIIQASIFKDPKWSTFPLDEKSKTAAVTNGESVATTLEKILLYLMREKRIRQRVVKRAFKNLLINPFSVILVGWEYEEKKNEKYKELDQTEELLVNEGILPPQKEVPTTILKDQIFVESLNPNRVVFDTEAENFEDIQWIAFEVRMDKEQAKKKYPKLKIMNIPSVSVVFPNEIEEKGKKDNRDDQRIVIYEYWELDEDGVAEKTVLLRGNNEEPLQEPSKPYMFKGLPARVFVDYEVVDRLDAISEIDLIRPQLEELNRSRSYMLNHLKRSHIKYLKKLGALTKKGENALVSGIDNAVIEVKDTTTTQNLRGAVDILQPGRIPNDNYEYEQIVNADMNEQTGISDFRLGFTPDSKRTATEIQEVSRGSDLRASEKQDIAEDMFNFIGERIIQLLQQFADREMIIPIVGDDVQFIEFTKNDIQGNYAVVVESGSTQAKTSAIAKKQAREMLQVLTPYPFVNQQESVKRYLESQGIQDTESFFQQQQGGGQVEDGEALAHEQALLAGETIPPSPSPTEDHIKHHFAFLERGKELGELQEEDIARINEHIDAEMNLLQKNEGGTMQGEVLPQPKMEAPTAEPKTPTPLV